MKKEAILLLLFIVSVSGVYAEMMISEIMYRSSGDDNKKEWTELYNNGPGSINISGWQLQAGTLVRSIIPYKGSEVIFPDSFVIVARNGENFSEEYPAYPGSIFSITLELSNGGKDLYLLNKDNEIMDFVNYTDIAKEKGYTIELNGSEKDNSDMKNWVKGVYMGNPGSIIKYNVPEIPPAENNQTAGNGNGGNTSTVPEFNYLGTILALISVGVIFIVGRNR
jgi:hypothetical protein